VYRFCETNKLGFNALKIHVALDYEIIRLFHPNNQSTR